jgi:hypothetical protein
MESLCVFLAACIIQGEAIAVGEVKDDAMGTDGYYSEADGRDNVGERETRRRRDCP